MRLVEFQNSRIQNQCTKTLPMVSMLERLGALGEAARANVAYPPWSFTFLKLQRLD